MATTKQKPEHWFKSTFKFIFSSPLTMIGFFAFIIVTLSYYNNAFAKEFFLWLLFIGGGTFVGTSGLIWLTCHLVSRYRAKNGLPASPITALEIIEGLWSLALRNSLTTFVACIALIGVMDYFHPMISIQAGIAVHNIFENLIKPILILVSFLCLWFIAMKMILSGVFKSGKKH